MLRDPVDCRSAFLFVLYVMTIELFHIPRSGEWWVEGIEPWVVTSSLDRWIMYHGYAGHDFRGQARHG